MSPGPFRRKPPWVFSSRARADQLVCDPRSYVRAWMEDGRALWAPCLSWAPGPASLASTGDGTYPTLYGQNWLVQICEDGSWVLYQRQGTEELSVIAWDVVPPVAGLTARHPTLAFDQAARPAIAWEEEDGIRLREYDEVNAEYHFVGPFDGHDPVLICDATVNYHVPDSDVVLFYLDGARETLCYRVQSENFATEHEHHTFSDPPVILDLSDIGGYRLQLRHSDQHGAVIDEGDSFQAILSDVYPIYVEERAVAVVGSLGDGAYQLVVLTRSEVIEAITSSVGSLEDGVLFNVILQRPEVIEGTTGTVGALNDGVLFNVIIQRDEVMDGATGTIGSLEDGVLFFTIIQRSEVLDDMTATVGSLEDGAYAAA